MKRDKQGYINSINKIKNEVYEIAGDLQDDGLFNTDLDMNFLQCASSLNRIKELLK